MKKIYFSVLAILFFLTANAQIINFPDANLKAKLLATNVNSSAAYNADMQFIAIDANADGEITVEEAANVYILSVIGNQFEPEELISDMTGIGYFVNMMELTCSNNLLTSLDLTGAVSLQRLNCSGNQISAVNLTGLNQLYSITVNNNQIVSLDAITFGNVNAVKWLHLNQNPISGNLDFQGFPNLERASCNYCSLTGINVTGLNALTHLGVLNNQLTSVDLSTLANLEEFSATNNQLTEVDFSNNPVFRRAYLQYNQITTLDLTHNPMNAYADIKNNNLTTLYIKNGGSDTIELSSNPNMAYVCADEFELNNSMLDNANPLTEINSYCSFVPGGTFYDIQGATHYDADSNGCAPTDTTVPNIKFAITSGANTGHAIADSTGNYTMHLQAGNYTVAPLLENPNYFVVSPPTATINFPAVGSPFLQDFCLTPNGTYHDLEITLVPQGSTRPGFNSNFKIVYKNKGNQIESGAIDLTFDGNLMGFVYANPNITSQSSNHLVWNFNNLIPFETREIYFTVNVNSPLDTPPVNLGDVLEFSAYVGSDATDVSPVDNTAGIVVQVVNSMDPNDKTCLEGTTVAPEMAGGYVHYQIRFENTGTANAENIVVRDMIDLIKFDINSLVPLDGSHDYYTRINGDKVEFIFENINLPFDDANNDGYVVFKIKTNPTLVLGDTFSNTASIYFDYNHPIVTDPAVTTIALLQTQDFEFSNYLSIYPNPANDILNIKAKNQTQIASLKIYDISGKLMLSIPDAVGISTLEISHLASGNYILHIDSNKGKSENKFIKY